MLIPEFQDGSKELQPIWELNQPEVCILAYSRYITKAFNNYFKSNYDRLKDHEGRLASHFQDFFVVMDTNNTYNFVHLTENGSVICKDKSIFILAKGITTGKGSNMLAKVLSEDRKCINFGSNEKTIPVFTEDIHAFIISESKPMYIKIFYEDILRSIYYESVERELYHSQEVYTPRMVQDGISEKIKVFKPSIDKFKSINPEIYF